MVVVCVCYSYFCSVGACKDPLLLFRGFLQVSTPSCYLQQNSWLDLMGLMRDTQFAGFSSKMYVCWWESVHLRGAGWYPCSILVFLLLCRHR